MTELQRWAFVEDHEGDLYLIKAEQVQDFESRLKEIDDHVVECAFEWVPNYRWERLYNEFLEAYGDKRVKGSINAWTFTEPRGHD